MSGFDSRKSYKIVNEKAKGSLALKNRGIDEKEVKDLMLNEP
jgi:hypothetical protein